MTAATEWRTSTTMRTIRLTTCSLLFVFLSGCAIQKSRAPQIAAPTADALNVATLVNEAQHDYIAFFQTVGSLEKQGALSAAQVAKLNAAGNNIRDLLDAAGGLTQTYAATQNQSVAQEITTYLTQAASIYAQIYAERASDLSSNANAKAAGAK